jgi:hypothetical protein
VTSYVCDGNGNLRGVGDPLVNRTSYSVGGYHTFRCVQVSGVLGSDPVRSPFPRLGPALDLGAARSSAVGRHPRTREHKRSGDTFATPGVALRARGRKQSMSGPATR